MKKRFTRVMVMAAVVVMMMAFMAIPAFATSAGNVSGAIESTWNAAQGQVKDIVNNVVFPVIDMILAILFLKDCYRIHGLS